MKKMILGLILLIIISGCSNNSENNHNNKKEIPKKNLQLDHDLKDFWIIIGKDGKDNILVNNPSHSLFGDMLEASIDIFGSNGVYSDVAKSSGNVLWEYKNKKNKIVTYRNGVLLIKKGMEYLVDTYGDQALSQLNYTEITIIKSSIYTKKLVEYAKQHGFEGEIIKSNDKFNDLQSIVEKSLD